MNATASLRLPQPLHRWRVGLLLGWALAMSAAIHAQPAANSFDQLLAQAARAETNGDLSAALAAYGQAEKQSANDAPRLCVLTKHYCDLMYAPGAAERKPELAQRALAAARQAVRADPDSATAHICVAVGYAKNFPFVSLRTEVAYSRQIKLESEKAIALDPRQDVAYYLLARWHWGVANMGLLARTIVKVVYGGLPRASHAEAIACFQKAIALAPGRIIHHAGLAAIYAASGEMQKARLEWEKCRALKPLDRDDADAQADALKALAHLPK